MKNPYNPETEPALFLWYNKKPIDYRSDTRGYDAVLLNYGWIKVEDRLPPVGKYILVFMGGFISVDFYPKSHKHQKLPYYQDRKLTHWMNLPLPPKQ